MKPKYQTIITNDEGLTGIVKVSDGNEFITSSPTVADNNTNPEQLIGAALATCLNATLEYMIDRDKLETTSKVEVTVQQFLDIKGYRFKIDAKVTIKDIPELQASEMLREAETRCPVAKLLANNSDVVVHL